MLNCFALHVRWPGSSGCELDPAGRPNSLDMVHKGIDPAMQVWGQGREHGLALQGLGIWQQGWDGALTPTAAAPPRFPTWGVIPWAGCCGSRGCTWPRRRGLKTRAHTIITGRVQKATYSAGPCARGAGEFPTLNLFGEAAAALPHQGSGASSWPHPPHSTPRDCH